MNDHALVEALRTQDPGALAVLYDTHAEGIYRYCWSLLLSSDSAQVALRDTLIAAEAHIDALADPERLRPWLYALARGECLRRRRPVPPDAGEALGEAAPPDDPGDADLRIMAWNATQSLPSADRELLELTARHALSTSDVAAILGSSPRQVEVAEEEARERLRDAITAEFLAGKGPYDCPGRARILTGFSGDLTAEMRGQLVRHVTHCEMCSPHRTRQVSAAKVFELLPAPSLPESLRVRVLSCFVDPELVPYRRYIAKRSAALDAAGFPCPGEKKARRWPQALAGALAAVAAVIAIGAIFHQFGGQDGGLSGVAVGAFPAPGEPPGIRMPWQPDPQDTTIRVEPILDSTATRPIGVLDPTLPLTPTRPPTTAVWTPTPPPSKTATPQDPPSELPGAGDPTRDPQGGHSTAQPTTPAKSPTPCPATPTPTKTATPIQTPTKTQTPTQVPTQVPTTPPPTDPPAESPAPGTPPPASPPTS
ncbi:sigma-70 family RNA polymerase sigma factor [Nonomuraea sp. NBC_01738]|uniref:RNA polymerase sigma factor n=1 Tax=Nonomuraea sp. NBC_01738 TaxID=2976003 RepID=UPI002E0D653B|nr:sigma-70 family RNA polymerase sigma factor [Nonomuraea sp. NBC_01738]